MGSLKNIMMIAVLAAVGYGVYVALSRNNMDSGGQRAVLTPGRWPTEGGDQPARSRRCRWEPAGRQMPACRSGSGMPSGAPAMPPAPQLMQSPAGGDRSWPPPGSLSGHRTGQRPGTAGPLAAQERPCWARRCRPTRGRRALGHGTPAGRSAVW